MLSKFSVINGEYIVKILTVTLIIQEVFSDFVAAGDSVSHTYLIVIRVWI